MDSGHRGWGPPAPGGNAHTSNAEQGQSQAPRPGASYGTPQHQTAQSPSLGSNGAPPPPNPPFSFHQPAHGLASLAGVSQSSPRQPPSTHRTDGLQAQTQQASGFPLPGITQATGQPGAADRERERAREIEHIHIKEEEDRRHRDQERQRLEQAPPHQPQAGPPMLHQPVAVGPRSIHGPNGLLGNPGLVGPQHGQMALGAPSGPVNIFAGGPVQPSQTQPGPQQQQQQLQASMLMPFPPGAQQAAQQQVAQGPGQQPILNDALSYLDQVKVQFADHPDVYNRFLDIMKDFKSGAIDTPGVIGRVSTLFAGNPELIQGFNTFLPPGYRIECGTTDDPNAIRVTTPMGTTIQNMHQPRPLSRQEDGMRPANGTFTPQPGAQSAQMMYSPSGRPMGPAAPGQQQHLSPLEAARMQEQLAMHAQEQRGVTSLQSAVSAAASGNTLRAGMSPRATPLPGQDSNGASTDPAAVEKRGPVEFNHAISYVNKIKNRFSAHPDIYKQFLEILQTYQRESKPIQDVYSQVTRLFGGAPDLLLDFKQFLPESAAQAKAAETARQQAEQNSMMSNVRGEDGGIYGSPVMSREAHIGTPSHGRGLPPVGNFAPTPISKDTRKRKNERQDTADSIAGPSGTKAAFGVQAGSSKRQKQAHQPAKGANDQPPPSPGLVPALPAPIAPTTSAATSEELSFFDRAKKAISNKNTMNEFLKLCNLFSQDLIDGTTLVYRAKAFIGGNPELMKWFQEFIGYDERDIVVENKARIPTGRVSLSNCRGLGPSYRLLPKRERQKTCSGRDELCNAVLNDEWASHPTWASEDSGFIAHKKNQNEEGLHRIEEERHDYDYNIEACGRTIQLLEPIAQQLRRMPDHEQKEYRLPKGLGGQSETIYKRIIMKIYGREKGHDVVEQLHATPYQVIPVLLNRLKERLESWKMAQREWEKVWRDQTQKMFWRSLDHQAVNNTKADKKQFQIKTLQTEIAVKHEEMRRQELVVRGTMRKPQLEFLADDTDVVVDAAALLIQYVKMNMEAEQPKLKGFLKEFFPLFFGLDVEAFNAQIDDRTGTMTPDLADESLSGAEDAGVPRGRKPAAKTSNLLRTALDRGRNGKMGRKDREDSNASASRASTPDVASNAGDPEDMAIDAAEEAAESKTEQPAYRWFEHSDLGNALGGRNIDPNEPQKRDTYPMWANTSMYGFIRMFFMLYDRLRKLKLAEEKAAKTVAHAMREKPAADLGINDKLPSDFFADVSETANYYNQMLGKFDDVLKGDLDFAPDVEEALRRFYLQTGYPLYPFEKLMVQTARNAVLVLNGEGKDKSWDIYQLFKKDRMKDTTTHSQSSDYKKAVERMVRDGDLYKIEYEQSKQKVNIFLAKKEDPAYFENGVSPLDHENRWRSYVASYQSFEPTEGVPKAQLELPMLDRNMRGMGANPKSLSYPPSPPLQATDIGAESTSAANGTDSDRAFNRLLAAQSEEKLDIRISVNGYKAVFQPKSQEAFSEPLRERGGDERSVRDAEEDLQHREEVMKDSYLMNNKGMVGMTKEDVERANEAFAKLAGSGAETGEAEAAAVDEEGVNGERMEVDG